MVVLAITTIQVVTEINTLVSLLIIIGIETVQVAMIMVTVNLDCALIWLIYNIW